MPDERPLQVALQKQPCHLLRVSAELRIKIYCFLLKYPDHITLWSPDHYSKSEDLGLLRTRQLIHREAVEVLYRENRFDVVCRGDSTSRHVEALNSVANRQIRRLNLEVYLSRLGRGANHTKDIVSAIGNGHQLRRLVIFYNVSGCTPAEVEGWMSVFKDVKIYGKVTIRRFGTKRRLALSKTKKAWLIESVQCRREATSQVYSQSTGFQHPVPEQPCHFLRIPAELRLMIYRLLLKPESQSIPLTDRYDCGFSRGVGILRVSHLIYQEASDVLYGENSFHVLCLPHFYLNYPKVLKFVADRQMRRLKLVVRFAQKERDIRSIQEIVSILNSAHCLKDLTIYYQTFHLLTRFCTPAGLEQRLMLFKDLKIHGKVTIECDPELDPEVRTRLIKSMQMPGQDNRSSFIRKIEEPAPAALANTPVDWPLHLPRV